MSSQSAFASGRSIIVQASGTNHSINIYGDAHLTLLLPTHLAPPAVPRNCRQNDTADFYLLSSFAVDIPFTGRDRELASLRAWLTSDKPISVRALIGPVGSGKTRLAVEAIRELPAVGPTSWDAGFLTKKKHGTSPLGGTCPPGVGSATRW
jgi:hypothetical protein